MKTSLASAQAPANIAFIKYWGKQDAKFNIPLNSSISMNLSAATTKTSVYFSDDFSRDVLFLDRQQAAPKALAKVTKHLDRMRLLAGVRQHAVVVSENSFPHSVGIASSASSFAALTLAASQALEIDFSQKQLSQMSRQGSGSSCRSIPDGFCEWIAGTDSESSYAHSLHAPEHWDLRDLVMIFEAPKKSVPSTAGHGLAPTSPLFKARLEYIDDALAQVASGLKNKDISEFGPAVEHETLNMHAVMLTSNPALLYLQSKTVEAMHLIYKLRDEGLQVYFTIDAGHCLHILCEPTDAQLVSSRVQAHIDGVQILECKPCVGARSTDDHLAYESFEMAQ